MEFISYYNYDIVLKEIMTTHWSVIAVETISFVLSKSLVEWF
jgi:hypothetical protein